MSTVDPARPSAKPLFWIGRSLRDLRKFPDAVRRTMGFALWQAQNGGKHLDAKPFRGFGGAGAVEIVADHHANAFRAVYTVRLAGAVYVLHAFQKKSKRGVKTPIAEKELIQKRLKMAVEHYEEWQSTKPDEGPEKNGGAEHERQGRRK